MEESGYGSRAKVAASVVLSIYHESSVVKSTVDSKYKVNVAV